MIVNLDHKVGPLRLADVLPQLATDVRYRVSMRDGGYQLISGVHRSCQRDGTLVFEQADGSMVVIAAGTWNSMLELPPVGSTRTLDLAHRAYHLGLADLSDLRIPGHWFASLTGSWDWEHLQAEIGG